MHFANVAIRVKSELAELHGERPGVLQGVTVRNRGLGATELLPARHAFIGAEPNTGWLDGCARLDEKGYVLTGLQSPTDTNSLGRSALQTSLPRVFAIGDARSGSTKQVAPAVGEGAAVVAQIHSVLSTSATVV